MVFDFDVLICGAGPVGLLLSIDLARRGIAVGVIEKLETPFVGSKGRGIQPRTQEILEQLDLLDDFRAVSGTYPPYRIYKADGVHEEPYAAHIESTADTPFPNIMLLPQAMTEQILRRRARELGVSLQLGSELIGADQNNEGVVVSIATMNGEKQLSARYLVGADGGKSTVRRLLGIRLDGETLPMRVIVGDVRIDGLSTDVWHRWPNAPGGQLLLCPLLGSNLYQVTAQVALEGDIDLSADAVSKLIQARIAPNLVRIGEMPWCNLLRMSLLLADRYRVGRIFIAGDAAHLHPPFGGQGLNTGVQDAFNLGWKLSAVVKGADASFLDSYESERRTVASSMLVLAGKLFYSFKEERKTERGTVTDQLSVNYRGSSLCGPARAGNAPLQPGDRAPDAQFRDAQGHATRLFDLLRHPGFTLLGKAVDPARLNSAIEGTSAKCYCIVPEREAGIANTILADPLNALRDGYGLADGETVLIRPDGYITGFFGEVDQMACRAVLTQFSGNI